MQQLQNNQSTTTIADTQNKTDNSVLHAGLNAMLDCLTVEQQMKVASYLLRQTRPMRAGTVSGANSQNR